MKFKEVPDDDPSAEWELESPMNEGRLKIKHISPKEKINAEIAEEVGGYSSERAIRYRLLLDAMDEKIARAKEGK